MATSSPKVRDLKRRPLPRLQALPQAVKWPSVRTTELCYLLSPGELKPEFWQLSHRLDRSSDSKELSSVLSVLSPKEATDWAWVSCTWGES